MMKTILKQFPGLLIVAILAAMFGMFLEFDSPPGDAQAFFYTHGVAQTGAINLVTSIYLGYRAFDTLGETIVLLLSVAGVMLFIGRKSHAKN